MANTLSAKYETSTRFVTISNGLKTLVSNADKVTLKGRNRLNAPFYVFIGNGEGVLVDANAESDVFDGAALVYVMPSTPGDLIIEITERVLKSVDDEEGSSVLTTNLIGDKDRNFAIGNIGTRIQFGRGEYDFDNTSAVSTWEDVIALQQEFDAVRVLFVNHRNAGGTTTSPTMLSTIATVGDANNATLDAADWSTSVTVASSGTWALTVASAVQRRSIIVSDWISKASIPRTDGGTKPLLAIRSWVNGGLLTMHGNSAHTQSFTNWATKPDGNIWKMRRSSGGNFASANQTNFSATAVASSESPVLGVQYMAKGRVITVMGIGDSITEGQATYIGEGFIAPAVWAKSDKNAVAYEYCNLGWSGAAYPVFENSLTDILAAGIIPDVLVLPSGSPNDISTTISAANISAQRLRMSRILSVCKTNRIIPIVWSWLPSNTSIKNYGATDSLRAAYATDIESRAGRGVLIAKASSTLSGASVGGQVQMLSGTTTDGIHPNDSGNLLLAGLLNAELNKI